jgi:hypothetical protein
VRRSSKAIDKAATKRAVWWSGTAPDPGVSMPVELGGGQAGGVSDVVCARQRDAGEGFAAEDAPPPFDEVEPGRADWDESVLNTRTPCQPVANRTTAVTGQIVGDQIEVAMRIGVVQRVEQLQVACGIARGRGLGQRLPVADAERAVDPGLLGATLIVQGHFDAVAIGRPARSRWKVARGYWTEFVDAEDRRLGRWVGVERDDAGPFGTKLGSLLVAHSRVRRQRTPSWRKMRRT